MKIDNALLIKNLRNVCIFEDLPIRTLQSIISAGVVEKYSKNETLIHEKEIDSRVYFILTGNVKITKMNKDGHEITLSMLSETDFFGELSAIDSMPRAATVVSLSPTTVFHITGAKFKELILSEIKIANALLLVLAERLRKTDEHINSLWLNGAYGKVAAAIIRIAEDFGTIKQGSVDITGIASHRNIASYAAVTRETCSRAFAMFEKEGFIIKTRNNVTLTNYQAFKNRFKI